MMSHIRAGTGWPAPCGSGSTCLVDVKVGEMNALVPQVLLPQAERLAGEPHQPVPVQIDGQRVQAGQQHVQPTPSSFYTIRLNIRIGSTAIKQF
jgi:hypothetical protein